MILSSVKNRTYLIKAVLSHSQTIAQVHERLPITPKTAYPAPGLLAGSSSGCAGIHWTGLVALPACHARVAPFRARQHSMAAAADVLTIRLFMRR